MRHRAIGSEESSRAAARSERARTPSCCWRLRPLAPLVCLITLALTAAAPAARAAEPLSGYGSTPPAPSTATTPPPAPQPAPSEEPRRAQQQESTSPSQEVTHSEETDEPSGLAATAATKPASPARSLPLTGRDVRSELALGLLLIAGGCMLLLVQRRGKSTRRFRHTGIDRWS